jgi:hypothetical protein
VVLIALLFGSAILHAATLPALLTEVFVFFFLPVLSNCLPKDVVTAAFTDPTGNSTPSRAPPAFSL